MRETVGDPLQSLWLTKSPLERRELLETVLWNQQLNVSSVEYHFKRPFDVLVEMSGKENWRSLVGDFETSLYGFSLKKRPRSALSVPKGS